MDVRVRRFPRRTEELFLAHLTDGGQQVQIIRTNPYEALYLTAAPDGTVWTVGYSLGSNGRVDLTLDSLRHFNASGKLMASAIPAKSVGILRATTGYLGFYQGRVGWYSPGSGSMADGSVGLQAYLEISPTDMTVLHSYPAAPRNGNDFVSGFALTPGGSVVVEMDHPRPGKHQPPDLYELDRSGNKWVSVDGPRDQEGYISALEGNDGESLVFSDVLVNKSERKLQVLDLSQIAKH